MLDEVRHMCYTRFVVKSVAGQVAVAAAGLFRAGMRLNNDRAAGGFIRGRYDG